MRKMLCKLALHSWFRQFDRWGSADVCRYCIAVRNPEPEDSGVTS